MKSYLRLFDCSSVAGFADRSSLTFLRDAYQFFCWISRISWLYVYSFTLSEHNPTSDKSVFCVWKLWTEPIGDTSWLIGNFPYISSVRLVSIPIPLFDEVPPATASFFA